MNKAFEREVELLENDLESGAISTKEFNQEMRELERDYRDAAQESAEQAFQDEFNRW